LNALSSRMASVLLEVESLSSILNRCRSKRTTTATISDVRSHFYVVETVGLDRGDRSGVSRLV